MKKGVPQALSAYQSSLAAVTQTLAELLQGNLENAATIIEQTVRSDPTLMMLPEFRDQIFAAGISLATDGAGVPEAAAPILEMLAKAPAAAGGIKAIRKTLELSQRDLGARLGCTGTTIARWENGATAPSPTALAELMRILGDQVVRAMPTELPGAQLKAFRKMLRLTQKQLAAKLDVEQTQVSQWENGARLSFAMRRRYRELMAQCGITRDQLKV